MQSIGNRIAPARFVAFILLLLLGIAAATYSLPYLPRGMLADIDPARTDLLLRLPLGILVGFDVAAIVFLASCLPLLWIDDPGVIRDHAKSNDANRAMLLVISGMVILVLLIAVAAETVGIHPQPLTKILVIATLLLAWLFSNTVYTLHYAHLAYMVASGDEAEGLEFPSTREPAYADFAYFAFTLGMTFQTSDVTIHDAGIRRTVTVHCLAAFIFNIGVLAFTINVIGG